MDAFDLALDMEKQTVRIYRDLAGRCLTHEGIKNILQMLADNHAKHVEALEDRKTRIAPKMSDTQAFREARKLFEEMHGKKETFSCDLDQLSLYKDARSLILKKRKLYTEMIDDADSEEGKALLSQLAEEEKKQAAVLDNIIAMVERPKMWLEDAEVFHLDEY
jgi:rubrerythrin